MPNPEFMRRAVEISREKMEANLGGPFGAVIVRDGEIIAEGFNMVTTANDPTAHAEVVAIREACSKIGDFSLKGSEIYTSCEPCPLCLAAIFWARIDRIYYANTRIDAAEIGFDDEILYQEIAKPHEKRQLPIHRLELAEARKVFDDWLLKDDRIEY